MLNCKINKISDGTIRAAGKKSHFLYSVHIQSYYLKISQYKFFKITNYVFYLSESEISANFINATD